MKPSEISVLPGELRRMAEAIESLPDFDTLPPLCQLSLSWDDEAGALLLSGQLATVFDDMRIISDLNAWAAAIGGSLLLSEEHRTSLDGRCWRRLTVLALLPGGLLFEVWNHLYYPAPAAAPEPVAA
jgi:hypothetical protein